MKKHIPNIITSLNLVCGCFALVAVFHQRFDAVLALVLAAGVLDFFDGFVARLLKVDGALGKQLDSLADVVTFGVVPGFVLYQMVVYSIGNKMPQLGIDSPIWYWAYLAMIIPVASAYRLAKFNLDTRQSSYFLGMPTPANGIFWAALPVMVKSSNNPTLIDWFGNPLFLIVLGFISALVMVAEIPLISFKFKHYQWKGNEGKYLLLLSSVVLLAFFQVSALPIIIVLYLLLSLVFKKQIVAP
jgi:CDP-diacylglycerol---serine O-phosphatidyltransferase